MIFFLFCSKILIWLIEQEGPRVLIAHLSTGISRVPTLSLKYNSLTQNIKHNSILENLGLWVYQAYLLCWIFLYKRYARNTLCKMLVSIFFIYIKLLCFIIFKTIAPQCSSYHMVPFYSNLVGKIKMTVYIHNYD